MPNYYSSRPIPVRLSFASEAITIAQTDIEVNEILARFGYQAEQFAEGFQLYESARDLDVNRRVQLGLQVAATAALKTGYSKLRRLFDSDRRLMRLVLETDVELYEVLRLDISTTTGREALAMQASHFYREILAREDVLEAVAARYKMTREAFEARQQELADFEAAMQRQQHRIGQAQVATRQRRQAMRQLDDWMARFIGVARVAFKGDERQLKKLGLFLQPSP